MLVILFYALLFLGASFYLFFLTFFHFFGFFFCSTFFLGKDYQNFIMNGCRAHRQVPMLINPPCGMASVDTKYAKIYVGGVFQQLYISTVHLLQYGSFVLHN